MASVPVIKIDLGSVGALITEAFKELEAQIALHALASEAVATAKDMLAMDIRPEIPDDLSPEDEDELDAEFDRIAGSALAHRAVLAARRRNRTS